VDTVVTALHRNNDVLKKQKATIVESMKELYKAINEVSDSVVRAADAFATEGAAGALEVLQASSTDASQQTGDQAWTPAIRQLREKLQALMESASKPAEKAGDFAEKLQAALNRAVEENQALREAQGPPGVLPDAEEIRKLREDNSKLRQNMKFMNSERERFQKELADFKAQLTSTAYSPVSEKVVNAESEVTDQRPVWRPPRTPSLEAASKISRPPSSGGTYSPASFVGTGPALSSSAKPGSSPDTSYLQAMITAAPLGDFEPIIERMEPGGRTASGASSSSPLRRTGNMLLSKSGSLGEFEPIIERGLFSKPPPPLPGAHLGTGASIGRIAKSPSRPQDQRPVPPAADAKVSQAYMKQVGQVAGGSKTKWNPGDMALWRGQVCRVVKGIPEDQPLCIVLKTPQGSEVTTDAFLLSEAPADACGVAAASLQQPPLRLAPLGDLFLDRPGNACVERPPTLPQSPRAFSHGSLPVSRGHSQGRPNSRERSAGRASCGSPMRFNTPPLCPTEGRPQVV